LTLRNTSKQYLRIKLPTNTTEVFSTKIFNVAVKPSKEFLDDGVWILLPLFQYIKREFITISLIVCVGDEPEMKNYGKLKFNFCKFDSPINQFNLNLYLPNSFEYSEFEGSLKEKKLNYGIDYSIEDIKERKFFFEKNLIVGDNKDSLECYYEKKYKNFLKKRFIDWKKNLKNILIVFFILFICCFFYFFLFKFI
jgi:hypothetical protein